MPALEALLDRFAAANTQPLGISVDSVHCHANWGASMGGISFPLLADFHPKGAMAASYGLYLDKGGITDRATVIIDADGIVRYAASVTPAGQRDIAALAAECEKINDRYDRPLPAPDAAPGLADGSVLYVRNNCGASRNALVALNNLHLTDTVQVRNVSEDDAAMTDLEKLTGGKQAPVLVCDDAPLLESKAIVAYLAKRTTVL